MTVAVAILGFNRVLANFLNGSDAMIDSKGESDMAYLSTYSRVIYASRWADTDRSPARMLAEILASAERNNAAAGVTGFLLYREGWFLQALEGDLDAVDLTFDRIRRDRRHLDVRIVADEPAFERAFPDWAMRAGNLGEVPETVLTGLGLGLNFDPARLDPEKAMALLTAAADAHRTLGRAA